MEKEDLKKATDEKAKELRELIGDDKKKGFIIITIDGNSDDIEGSSKVNISLYGTNAVLARGWIGTVQDKGFQSVLNMVNKMIECCDFEATDIEK